jgi:hypothetical protein
MVGKARENRWVFRRRLKDETLSLVRTATGSEFQISGADTENARLPSSVLVLGTNRVGAADERSTRPVSFSCSKDARYAGVDVVWALYVVSASSYSMRCRTGANEETVESAWRLLVDQMTSQSAPPDFARAEACLWQQPVPHGAVRCNSPSSRILCYSRSAWQRRQKEHDECVEEHADDRCKP